jgi:hypothetical protein
MPHFTTYQPPRPCPSRPYGSCEYSQALVQAPSPETAGELMQRQDFAAVAHNYGRRPDQRLAYICRHCGQEEK